MGLNCFRDYDWLCRIDDIAMLGVKYVVICAFAYMFYKITKRL